MRHSIFFPRSSTRSRRVSAKPLAAIALAGALAAALSGCSAAPQAASVNGQAISQSQLSDQLEAWSSSPDFVTEEDAEFLAQAEQAEQSGQTNVPTNTVEGAGSGPDVYGMYWTTQELSNLITALAVHQYLQGHGNAPSAVQMAASWASEDAENPTEWSQLPPRARASAAEEDAEHALVEGKLTDVKADRSFYDSHQSEFWSQVCLQTADLTVTGANGSVNMPASEKEAQEVARELNSHSRGTQALVASGARYCLSPENFIMQPSTFTKQVGALSPGQATILAESYGYQVVEVRSRVEIPYSNAIAGDIEIVSAKGGSQAEPNGDTPVIDILKAAKVDVNSEYGTWATTIPAPYPPEVLPPGESA